MNIPALLMAGLCLLSPKALALTEEGDYTVQVTVPEIVDESEPERKYLGTYYITGYDACARCCGKSDGITASGTRAEVGRTIATGREFDFGTRLYIEGIGERTVEDRGVGNGCIDVFCADHPECYALTGWYDVYLEG